jgi:hypothetical protein
LTKHGLAAAFVAQAIACTDKPPFEKRNCLIWPFNRNNRGYGQTWRNGRDLLVSRVVCEEVHGPPPTPKHEASHLCENGKSGCVNGSHLIWETRAENHARRQDASRCYKLNEHDVRAIRLFYLPGRGGNTQALAARYGICRHTLNKIVRGDRWKHVP